MSTTTDQTAPVALPQGFMTLDADPQYGWHLLFARGNGKPKNAFYTQAQLAQLVKLALVRMAESMSAEEKAAFLKDVEAQLTPKPRDRRARANGAAPSKSARAAAAAAGKPIA